MAAIILGIRSRWFSFVAGKKTEEEKKEEKREENIGTDVVFPT